MITITVVKAGGKYIGQTFSDRWNLFTIAENSRLMGVDVNKLGFTEFRRVVAGFGFKVHSKGAALPRVVKTEAEAEACRGAEVSMAPVWWVAA